MAMQVSWIEPDHVRSLAECLRPPPPPPADEPRLRSLDMLPETERLVVESFAGALSTAWEPSHAPAEAPQEPAEDAFVSEDEPQDLPPPVESQAPVLSQITAIRLKLRAVRERAEQAGILPRHAEEDRQQPPTKAGPSIDPFTSPSAMPAPDVEWNTAAMPSQMQPLPQEAPSPVRVEVPASASFPPNAAETYSNDREGTVCALPSSTLPVVPLGSVLDRLEGFAAWTHSWLGPCDLLVVDEHGDLLWGPQAQAALILSTLMAWSASMRDSAAAACDMSGLLCQPVPGGRMLSVVPCRTRLGLIQVAISRAEPLTASEAEELRQCFGQFLDAGDAGA